MTLIYLGAAGGALWSTRAWALIVVGIVWSGLTLGVLAGMLRRQSRLRYDLAVEKAAILQDQQRTLQRVAALEERARIAREMHDVLGHSLNAIAVQAEGSRYLLTSDPDQANRALSHIASLSRSTVDEVRGLIDVLHTDEDNDTTTPTPSAQKVPELVEDFRALGVTIHADVTGDLTTVPPQAGLAAYRIIQESLTNALKYSQGSTVTLHLNIGTDRMGIRVHTPGPLHASTVAQGHGLVGMRERAEALGGTFDAGPDPETGGWLVTAQLPWRTP